MPMKSFSSEGLLSVIVPNYNYGRFIEEAIRSVQRQSYAPIELVVIDDGSTDDSCERVRDLMSRTNGISRMELIETGENRGKLAAINTGLQYCFGEYCIILDADDLLNENYARRCIRNLIDARKRSPSVGFVYTNCKLIGKHGDVLGHGKSTAFDPQLIEEFSFIPEPAVVLMSTMIEAAPFDESIRKGTKHHKWRRIIANGWSGNHIPEPLFSYRMHDENLSGIGSRVLEEIDSGHRGERILSGYWPTQARQ